MKTLLLIALLTTTAFAVAAPAADARELPPPPCQPHVGPGYVIVQCEGPIQGCVWLTFDPYHYYCY
jgi:hypothetical protein